MDSATTASYLRTVPRTRMSAAALIRDTGDNVLLVKPTYRPEWILPGGAVEQDESPQTGCAREVVEELGLTIQLGRLLAVQWWPPEGRWDAAQNFVFDGGQHEADELASRIRLQREELDQWGWFPLTEARVMTPDWLAEYLVAATDAMRRGSVAELWH